MHPLSALVLLILCIAVFAASRRGAMLALLAGALYLSQVDAIHVGLNLFPTRVLEIVLLLRITTRKEWSSFRLNAIDRAFLWLYFFTTAVFLLRSKDGLIFQFGVAVDAFLVYFSCRALIETPEDFRWLLRSFVLLLIPFVLAVAIERIRGSTPLSALGWGAYGVWMREGKVRCFGSFRNPSLLGMISVSFVPILFGLAFRPENRKRAALGIALCLIIIWAANSGGPVSGLLVGGLSWMLWKIRTKMRQVRWGLVALIAMAAILMKAPVWYLISHVSDITGGDGWHRAYLMDISFQNFGKWWLAGMPIQDTSDWFPYTVADNVADITNQFVAFGLTAGLGAIALFILLLGRAFGALGRAMQVVRESSPQTSEAEFVLWGLGAMLAAHIVDWFGMTYFDQTYVFWFTQLALISTLSQWYLQTPSETAAVTQQEEADSELQESPLHVSAQ